MALAEKDKRALGLMIKNARLDKHMSQASCAEVLDISLSFQKDIERYRYAPSLEVFFRICRTFNQSADAIIFPDSHTPDSVRDQLDRILNNCSEKQLEILLATAEAMLKLSEDSESSPQS